MFANQISRALAYVLHPLRLWDEEYITMSRNRSREADVSSDGVEMRPYQKSPQAPDWDEQDDDDDTGVLDEDPQLRRASVQSFELYTPDEEKRVVRKLDLYVVAFMSFLYLLSFLDRTSRSCGRRPCCR